MRALPRFLLLTVPATTLLACGGDSSSKPTPDADTHASDGTSTDGDDGADGIGPPPCNRDLLPIVMLHGHLESADVWAPFAQRFAANGYCPDHLYALDYNSFDLGTAPDILAATITQALAATGDSRAHLIAHGIGGALAYRYMALPDQAAKIEDYAHLASYTAPLDGTPPQPPGVNGEPIPTVAIRAATDPYIPSEDIPDVLNFTLQNVDHIQVATSPTAFDDVFSFFAAGQRPTVTTLPAETAPRIAGKALAYAENAPAAGWTLEVFPIDAATGKRKDNEPFHTVTLDDDGSFPAFTVDPATSYEFFLHGPGLTDQPVHHFFAPFTVSNAWLRLRTMPLPGTRVGDPLQAMTYGPAHANLAIFAPTQAILTGRDSLKLNGEELANPTFTPATRLANAFFIFDAGADQADGDHLAAFATAEPFFFVGFDRFLRSGATPIVIDFNGRTFTLLARRSAPDGATALNL